MNKNRVYTTYENQKIILRDILAAERTLLANERTYLAYLRTAVGFLAAGITLIKYVDDGLCLQVLGCLFIFSSIITFYFGTKRFFETKKPIKNIFN